MFLEDDTLNPQLGVHSPFRVQGWCSIDLQVVNLGATAFGLWQAIKFRRA